MLFRYQSLSVDINVILTDKYFRHPSSSKNVNPNYHHFWYNYYNNSPILSYIAHKIFQSWCFTDLLCILNRLRIYSAYVFSSKCLTVNVPPCSLSLISGQYWAHLFYHNEKYLLNAYMWIKQIGIIMFISLKSMKIST